MNPNEETIQINKNGIKVYSITFQLMNQFLGESTELPKEVFYQCKKLNNEYKDRRNSQINEIYQKIKKVKPVVFNYDEDDLFFFIEHIIKTNKKLLLKYLVVPSKYIGYCGQVDDNIYNYYFNLFKKLSKGKKVKQFKEFLIKGVNYKNMINLLNEIIYSSSKLMKFGFIT